MLNHVLSKLTLPEKRTKRSLRMTVTRQGVMELSEPVDVDTAVPMDLVIVGSVAVSSKGFAMIHLISLSTRVLVNRRRLQQGWPI